MGLRSYIEQVYRRRQAYRMMFLNDKGELNENAKVVLADLARFCRAHRSVAVVSPISQQMDVPATFMAEGRREVWLRIWAILGQNDADLNKLREGEEAHGRDSSTSGTSD